MKALALIWLVAHAAPLEDAIPGPAWDGESWRAYADPTAQVSFEVPFAGFRLEARHFPEAREIGQAKHILVLSGPGGDELAIDVFQNDGPADADDFTARYLPFLRLGDVSVASVMVRGPNRPGLLFVQPRGTAFERHTVVFAQGDKVYRITCLSAEDPRTRAVFRHALETFRVEVAR